MGYRRHWVSKLFRNLQHCLWPFELVCHLREHLQLSVVRMSLQRAVRDMNRCILIRWRISTVKVHAVNLKQEMICTPRTPCREQNPDAPLPLMKGPQRMRGPLGSPMRPPAGPRWGGPLS
jgi:hypothetical protein